MEESDLTPRDDSDRILGILENMGKKKIKKERKQKSTASSQNNVFQIRLLMPERVQRSQCPLGSVLGSCGVQNRPSLCSFCMPLPIQLPGGEDVMI